MRVEKLQFNNILPTKPAMQADFGVPSEQRSVETSIYDKKGLTLPFGCWNKGANEAEEACIKMFRKVREGRCRKYTEPQIAGFMKELCANPREKNIQSVVNELFETHKICVEEFAASSGSTKPDADFVRNYLRVAKNCDADERLGLIGFTQHELCVGATKPLEALANSKPEQQNKFIKLMNDISFSMDDTEKAANLYDDLRHVIYAAEDLPKLDAQGKLQYLSDVQSDYKNLKASGEDEKIIAISRDIVDTMMDVLKI